MGILPDKLEVSEKTKLDKNLGYAEIRSINETITLCQSSVDKAVVRACDESELIRKIVKHRVGEYSGFIGDIGLIEEEVKVISAYIRDCFEKEV